MPLGEQSILCEITNSAIKTTCQFKGVCHGLMLRRWHKILRIIYSLLSRVTAYIDPDFNYEELVVKRNMLRWIQATSYLCYN